MPQCGSNYRAFVLVALLCVAALPFKTASQSRSKTCPPVRLTPADLIRESGAATTLQPGTILVCRLEREINSKTAQPGDRIDAWVVEPITDRRGVLLVPRNSKVAGRIERVYHAGARRPAMIEVGFDTLQRCPIETRGGRTRDGCDPRRAEIVQLTGVLVPLTKENCKTINSDGSLEGRGPSAKRTFAFVAGGAGGGAIIGGLTTGALLGAGVGAGIGAGIGAATSLFGRGRQIKVAAGTKFGLELTRPLPLRSFSQRAPSEVRPARAPIRRPPPPSGLAARLVPVRDIRVTQEQNGEIRILATGVAPNNTWEVYLENKGVQNGVLNLTMMGYPTQSWAVKEVAPVRKQFQLLWPDVYHRVRRVVVRGDQNSLSQAYIYPPGSGVPGSNAPSGQESAVDPTGQRIARQLETLARDYERDLDGRPRGATPSQTRLLNELERAAETARVLRTPLTPEAKRNAVSKLTFRADAVNRAMAEVPSFPAGYRQRWQSIQAEVDELAENTAGVVKP